MPCCSFDDVEADSGLGGRLVTRVEPFGGRGKEPMLVVFLTVLGMPEPMGGDGEGAGRVSLVDKVGTAGVELALVGLFGVGRPEMVTAREGMDVFFDEGGGMLEAVEVRLDSEAVASSLYLRVLETGNAGNGPVGGGRGVLGPERVDAIVVGCFATCDHAATDAPTRSSCGSSRPVCCSPATCHLSMRVAVEAAGVEVAHSPLCVVRNER